MIFDVLGFFSFAVWLLLGSIRSVSEPCTVTFSIFHGKVGYLFSLGTLQSIISDMYSRSASIFMFTVAHNNPMSLLHFDVFVSKKDVFVFS